MPRRRTNWYRSALLFFIVILGFFLRVYHVRSNPPSMSWDEVSIGYNAYSILKTGHDEHGIFMPLSAFTAYGDYKPPLSIYITVPFVAVFGLNELAVRLPSVLAGTIAILLVYFVTFELIKSRRAVGEFMFFNRRAQMLSVLAAGIFSVSPWHINISRAGFEANIALTLVLWSVLLFLRSLNRPALLRFMWLPMCLSVYTFNSARYFAPMLGVLLIIYIRRTVLANRMLFFTGCALSLIVLLPILPHLFSREARLRFTEVNIFTDAAVVTKANQRLERQGDGILSNIVNNRRIGYARSFLMHFTDNLNPDFLFVRGDGNPKFSIRDVGQMHLAEAPLLAVGIYALGSISPALAGLLIGWIVLSIVPAATARETPHALRILNSLPVWQIFIAFGIVYLHGKAKTLRPYGSMVFISCMVFAYSISTGYYLHQYYAHYPIEFSSEWQYGYREAVMKARALQDSYDRIVMTGLIGRPYMYALFYTQTDPASYITSKKSYFDDAGFYHVTGFGKFEFPERLDYALNPGTLYIWDAGSVPAGARIIDSVRLLNGEQRLVLFDAGKGSK